MTTRTFTQHKCHEQLGRHSGERQNPVKTIVYWMLEYTNMTVQVLVQKFLRSQITGLILFIALVPSWNASAGEPEAKLEKLLQELDSYSAAFEQTLSNNTGETTERAIGVVYMQRPGRIHWAYWEPYIQLIVSDGVSVWNYEEDLEQVIIRDASDSIEDSPAAVLAGEVDLAEHYIVLDLDDEEGIDWLELTPKDLDAQYESIHLGFVAEQLSGMVLNDGLGNRTNIRFLDSKKNPKLALELFRFTPPEGVDVIDNRASQGGEEPEAE